jgi:hypothetical protein
MPDTQALGGANYESTTPPEFLKKIRKEGNINNKK